MNKNLENQIKEELEEINQKNLMRKIDNLRFVTSTRAIDENGKEYLVYGTNNYLGLTHHPDVIKSAQTASVNGTGSTGSRLTTGGTFEASELEKNILNTNRMYPPSHIYMLHSPYFAYALLSFVSHFLQCIQSCFR